ncbi:MULTISPECIES: hypothetical protein, partial [Spirulina sp. CCY15215]|uniref:hypothetical protein n=1 Tax=Spirulina sp. CCY15215 TaxID=2767591 RepID=UPI00194FDA07
MSLWEISTIFAIIFPVIIYRVSPTRGCTACIIESKVLTLSFFEAMVQQLSPLTIEDKVLYPDSDG